MTTSEQVKQARAAEREQRAVGVLGRRGLPAIGLEAEFSTIVDGEVARPEEVFGSPRRIIRGPLVHRTGRSYHLPTGGAVYFDTGVIEIATPMIEIERGCGARATRSLWESLAFLRAELDAWEVRTGRSVRLAGFSAHYNVSFDLPEGEPANGRSVEQLAYLLTYLLATPVMLLAANRRSTGIGVRPRGNRIEITADFTPDAGLTAATATLIVGVVREVMRWPSYDLAELDARGLPIVSGFAPDIHSSRKGWVAGQACFPRNPFTSEVDAATWRTRLGPTLSLRQMAGRITRRFWPSILALGDPLSMQLIGAVMRGGAASLLELDERPAAYDDVGRLCTWNDLFPVLSRSRYERVLGHAIAGRRVRIDGGWHRPVGVRGWTHIVFRREADGARRVRSLDELLAHLDAWDRTADRRFSERRSGEHVAVPDERRRAGDRRAPPEDTLDRRDASEADAALELGPPPPAELEIGLDPVGPAGAAPRASPEATEGAAEEAAAEAVRVAREVARRAARDMAWFAARHAH